MKVWQKIKDIDEISEYFLDLKEGELPDRNYMWNVLNTLKPNSTKSIIKAGIKNRSIENEGDSDNMIEIAPEYLEKLLSIGIQKVKVMRFVNLNLYRIQEENQLTFFANQQNLRETRNLQKPLKQTTICSAKKKFLFYIMVDK